MAVTYSPGVGDASRSWATEAEQSKVARARAGLTGVGGAGDVRKG